MDNEKNLFIKEQAFNDKKRKEDEAAREVSKERQMKEFEELGKMQARDPKESSLSFMYVQPNKDKTKAGSAEGGSNDAAPNAVFHDSTEDDAAVKAFKESLRRHRERDTQHPSSSSSSTSDRDQVEKHRDADALKAQQFEREQQLRKIKADPNFAASSRQSALEREVGRRHDPGLTQEEQEERFPFLKDAPTEGSYSKTVKLKHKPLGFEVRNVRCLRCGSWGHQSGDRECSMRDYNPHDAARQKREDPMAYISGSLHVEKQKLILKQALVDRPAKVDDFIDDDDDEGGESDPEAEFLATLTSKEKKKLLKRLKELDDNMMPEHSAAAHRPEDGSARLRQKIF